MEIINMGYLNELHAEKLKRFYEIAHPRVQRHLQAELDYILNHIKTGDQVLEVGCGYGRIISKIANQAGLVVGIDISAPSLKYAQRYLKKIDHCLLLIMDATALNFSDDIFDVVVCCQNGISKFQCDQQKFVQECYRVTKPGGTVLFSTYSEKFLPQLIKWFQLQAQDGLLSEIDHFKIENAFIFFKDKFQFCNVQQFLVLTRRLDAEVRINEVDESSLFCEIKKVRR